MDIFTDAEIIDFIESWCAYDTGCTDSGSKDPKKRHDVCQYLAGVLVSNESYLDNLIKKHLIDDFLTDKPGENVYTTEDVKMFLDWYYDTFLPEISDFIID